MPALPLARDALSQTDGLATHEVDSSSLIPRQPVIDYTSQGTANLNALAENTIVRRQQGQGTVYQGIIPSYYNLSGPGAGTVVGIVLGSVAGFLLIVWLLYSLANIGGGRNANIAGEEEIVVRRPRRNSHSGRSRRSTRTEVREYSRSPRRSGGRSAVIVEERRAPRPRSVLVEERVRVPNDDVVEVIEEHDEYRTRRGSRRGGYR